MTTAPKHCQTCDDQCCGPAELEIERLKQREKDLTDVLEEIRTLSTDKHAIALAAMALGIV